ncbi:hypothetical protein PROVRETT_09143 [Providencia rettgeri DSM 1131]|uniref:hypothetical protein n=1 Tax=Providencia rettgeri TaxID=587 RepID=UPI000197C067|nr:hypothetical protein [Providencia rettgeri]EFE51978.1 hypothetical protein PROVRETT_09143 [Providencia rettgeri DSM 1131]QXA57656.1 hypothetical protein I6L79_20240 [Providencia rettgeri]
MGDNSVWYVIGKIINETSGSISLLVIFSSLTYFYWMLSKDKKRGKVICWGFCIISIAIMVPTAGYLDKSFSDSFLLAGYSPIIGSILAWAIIAFCCLAALMTLTLAYKANRDSE